MVDPRDEDLEELRAYHALLGRMLNATDPVKRARLLTQLLNSTNDAHSALRRQRQAETLLVLAGHGGGRRGSESPEPRTKVEAGRLLDLSPGQVGNIAKGRQDSRPSSRYRARVAADPEGA